ncbi:MAG: hypothetical protein H6Q31_329 [Bacteroidetes bacterium]|nr:hypothetical protein [Bacteroidota bacterium]
MKSRLRLSQGSRILRADHKNLFDQLRMAGVTMKTVGMIGCLILASLEIGLGQVVSGRSGVGSLSVTAVDSSALNSGIKARAVAYEFEFTEPSGDNFLESRETGRLRLMITNSGKVSLRNVVARIIPLARPADVTFNDSIDVGEIPVGATRYAIFHFTAAENVRSQILTFQIDIHDPQGTIADSRLFTFLTRARRGG